ncbi:MAG: TIGR01244 family sulfur transferase [Hyphomicrobiaceae bacterium]|nr:TIGR01244 family sulfur transferase [Hyphomicrobiaceae bacterium]
MTFRHLSGTVFASPQIGGDEIAAAAAQGIVLVINNRPDGEEPSQPDGYEIEAAARAAGLDYIAIPVSNGFDEGQVTQMAAALEQAQGPVLAFCRSGTRSTFLWALASAHRGGDPEAILAAVAAAGYPAETIRPAVERLAANRAG